MWPFTRSQKLQYEAVAGDEDEQRKEGRVKKRTFSPRRNRRPVWLYALPVVLMTLVTVVAFAAGGFQVGWDSPTGPAKGSRPAKGPKVQPAQPAQGDYQSKNCATRREWRTLNSTEQQDYISSVLCLRDHPSQLGANTSLYDDFPWIHAHVGYYTHNSAPFMPWHRYFLHIYEKALRDKCGYKGGLVYWDWTLDSEALEKSPVFSAESGFGGDGEKDGEITVGKTGRCLKDGPFTDIVADYYDVKYHPHCLSRGFRNDEGELGHIDGTDISPSSIEEVLNMDDYEDFVALMESRVHDTIPFGIGGDFETFTAPYDPLFYLHHVQLDRLWWLWQQSSPEKQSAYDGHKQKHSMKMATLDDVINMKGLDVNIKVADVMSTEGDLLCYRY